MIWNQDIQATIDKPFRCFFVTTPAPFVSGGMCYGLVFVPDIMDVPFETMICSLSAVEAGLGIGMARKPNGLVIFPSLAMKLAEELEKRAAGQAKQTFKKKKSLKNLIRTHFIP